MRTSGSKPGSAPESGAGRNAAAEPLAEPPCCRGFRGTAPASQRCARGERPRRHRCSALRGSDRRCGFERGAKWPPGGMSSFIAPAAPTITTGTNSLVRLFFRPLRDRPLSLDSRFRWFHSGSGGQTIQMRAAWGPRRTPAERMELPATMHVRDENEVVRLANGTRIEVSPFVIRTQA